MSLATGLVQGLQKNRRRLFHFTDSRNIPNIKAHGLLPTADLPQLGICAVTGGDVDSLGIDRHKGLDKFVRLSFCRQHPMAHVARERGNIETVRILTICPTVLLYPGVMLSDRVATANDAEISIPDEMIPKMDFEATYQFLDWKVPGNFARRNAAEKWEALIPHKIAVDLIMGL